MTDARLLAVVKDSDRYAIVYRNDNRGRSEALRQLGRWASCPDLNFSWYDAGRFETRRRRRFDCEPIPLSPGRRAQDATATGALKRGTMMTKDEKLKLCRGCRDDFYNHGGNSTTGECWMLKTAKPVERTSVGTWQNPPYRWHPQTTLSCHTPQGQHWIKQDDPRIREAAGQ